MRDEKRNRTEMFLKAFKLLIANKRIKSQKELAAETGISVPFISQVKNDKRYPAYDTQVAIARAYGKSLDEFIALSDTVDVEVRRNGKEIPPPVPLASAPNNVHLLPAREKPPPTPVELQAQAMRDNLEIILRSGDAEIIESIRSNLVTFKRTVELAMEIRTLKAENKDVLKRLKRLEGSA